jgi:hypothetical protein
MISDPRLTPRLARIRWVPALLPGTIALALAACGGGGGDTAPSQASGPVPVVLSGVAATGAAMVGATVRVVDARGQNVASSDAVGSDGRFSVTLPAEARAPFALEALLPDGERQVSVIDSASGATIVNITPITSLIAARLSPTGTPEGLVQRFEQAMPPTAVDIGARRQEVLDVIAPLRQALGDTTDPVSGSFSVGGTGHDHLLDSLTVTIVPSAATSANIELTVRTRRDDETPLPAVAFASNAPAGQLPTVGTGLRREDLGAAGVSARIEALVAELNRCYGLPVDERVTSTTSTPRSAALVKDGPCKTMYYQADPAQFLDNGAVVGNGAGNGLFSADTLVFDRPVYEYTRAPVPNESPEMVVFTVRWTNQRTQARDSMVVHLRDDGTGALKLYGNQYRHGMSVRPIVQRQTHLRADSGHMDNLRSGYNLLVVNQQQGGQLLYDRVEVTAPVGLERSATRDVFVLRPAVGFTHLRMTGQFLDTRSSNVVWMGAGWIDGTAAATTPTVSGRTIAHPIELDGGGAVWVNDPGQRGWSDERLERLSHKSVWTFRYFLRGNTGSTPDAVQSLTTISRAPSIREVTQQPFAVFNAATRDRMRAFSMDPAANLLWMSTRADATAPAVTEPPALDFFAWDVPAAAVAPTNLNGFGRTTASYATPWEQRTAFDRLVPVASTQREGGIGCSTSDSALRAVLCHDGGGSDRFSLKTMFTDIELWGKDLRQVEYSHSYATYRPSTRRTADNPSIQNLNAAN